MKRLIAPLLILLLLLTGCRSKPVQQQFFAMDTVMSIRTHTAGAEQAITKAIQEINRLEELFSRTRINSEISQLNANGACTLSPDTLSVFTTALTWHRKTHGAFDITIAPVSSAWGFSGETEHHIPSQAELNSLLPLVDSNAVILQGSQCTLSKEQMEIDLGGIAKGYAAGRAEKVLRENGVQSALLDLGGNITVIGSKPDGSAWQIAVQDPQNSSATVGILSLQDCSAITSGGYQRFFEQDGATYHHIIDPSTGYPADSGLLSTTVVCADPALGDLLSTATFILGEKDALDLWRAESCFELILVTEDQRIVVTSGLKDKFKPSSNTYTLEYAQ